MRPILFEVFGLPIRGYGLMLAVGFVLATWAASRRARRYGVEVERIYDIALLSLVSGVIGARALFILLNPGSESFKRFYAVWDGGLSFLGGLMLATLAAYIYCRGIRIAFWKVVDVVTPSIALAYAVTKLGCFLNGCCYGCPTDLPWAVRFPHEGTLTPPSHPAQVYSFLANLLIFGLLLLIDGGKQRRQGFLFACYVVMYGAYRFLIEILRAGYTARMLPMGITEAQLASLVMIVGGGVALVVLARRRTA